MLDSIRLLHEDLNNEKIEYCHWKSNEHLTEALNGDTDLDMLFLPEQRNKIQRILAENGLKRFRATPSMQYNAIEDFIGFDKKTAKIWHLHLHYRLTLGEKHLKGYTVPWGRHILSDRINNNEYDVYTSKPEDELFLLYVRIALKLRWRDNGKTLGSDDIAEINWLKKRASITEFLSIVEKRIGSNHLSEFEFLFNLNEYNNSKFRPLQKMLRKSMKFYTSHNKAGSFLHRSIREFTWGIGGISRKIGVNLEKPKRRISPSGGAVIAFLGSDGAGKSTTIEYVRSEFNKKIDVKDIYMGSGDGSSSLLRFPLKLIAKKVGGKGLGKTVSVEMSDENKKTNLKSKLYTISKFIWAITLAFEKRSKINKITKARNNGVLVLTDRYPQVDTVGYNDGPLLTKYSKSSNWFLNSISKWEYGIYQSSYINEPDLIIKLIVPIDVAIARKPEMSAEEISNKINAVRKVRLSNNSVEIDTNKEKITSFGEVMASIWEII